MVLDYLRQIYGEEIPNLAVSKLAKKMKTDAKHGGQTIIDNVSLINELLRSPNLSIRFVSKYPCDWKTAIRENEKEHPVIAVIWDADRRDPYVGTGHSVVITNIDRENGIVYYNDPARGKTSMDTVTFISQWENENVDKTLILVELKRIVHNGKTKQKVLPEYSPEV